MWVGRLGQAEFLFSTDMQNHKAKTQGGSSVWERPSQDGYSFEEKPAQMVKVYLISDSVCGDWWVNGEAQSWWCLGMRCSVI